MSRVSAPKLDEENLLVAMAAEFGIFQREMNRCRSILPGQPCTSNPAFPPLGHKSRFVMIEAITPVSFP